MIIALPKSAKFFVNRIKNVPKNAGTEIGSNTLFILSNIFAPNDLDTAIRL